MQNLGYSPCSSTSVTTKTISLNTVHDVRESISQWCYQHGEIKDQQYSHVARSSCFVAMKRWKSAKTEDA